MPYLLNLLYLLALLALSPWLVYKMLTTGKYRRGMWRKLSGLTPIPSSEKPRVWFHAVSVGEVLLLKQVIARFRARYPDYECVLSTTTNTGCAVAVEKFPDLTVFYWPLDFTWAVRRALRRIKPELVILAELELWPNFILAAHKANVPVAVINGRMTERSSRGYRRVRWLLSRVIRKIAVFAVQTEAYGERFAELGIPREQIHVTGSVKYDGVNTNRNNQRTDELGHILGLAPRELVWIVGSTQAPEERLALEIYCRLKARVPNLRLIVVPRHAERFEEVARLIQASGRPMLRRSQIVNRPPARCSEEAVILLDTLGELGAAWGLADVAFVGGSLSGRGGQNMIEPAAYGAAVTFGPDVWNFRETVDRLLERRAALQVQDATDWEHETLRLLLNPDARAVLGEGAREFVLSQQGATERTLELLEPILLAAKTAARAA